MADLFMVQQPLRAFRRKTSHRAGMDAIFDPSPSGGGWALLPADQVSTRTAYPYSNRSCRNGASYRRVAGSTKNWPEACFKDVLTRLNAARSPHRGITAASPHISRALTVCSFGDVFS
jgi:transposase